MRRTRRKEAVFWLPPNGPGTDVSPFPLGTGWGGTIQVSGTQSVTRVGIGVPFQDNKFTGLVSGIDFPGNLALQENQDYLLKRIVGKVWCWYIPSNSGGNSPETIEVTAGFFVARQDPLQGIPIGYTGLQTTQDNESYNPGALATQCEPWIWRRSWLLSGVQGTSYNNLRFPGSNAGYGSVMDGPHVDARTKRRVSSDDRVFFAIGVTTVLSGINLNGAMQYWVDVRGLGSMRRPHNRGSM